MSKTPKKRRLSPERPSMPVLRLILLLVGHRLVGRRPAEGPREGQGRHQSLQKMVSKEGVGVVRYVGACGEPEEKAAGSGAGGQSINP